MGILTHLKEQNKKEANSKGKELKFKGSLTGTLVWTLLIFAMLPLVVVSGGAYIRARSMIRELSLNQTQVVMTAQLQQSMQKVEEKEELLTEFVQGQQFSQELEAAFHANRQSSTYAEIHSGILHRFTIINAAKDKPKFNHFFLLDPDASETFKPGLAVRLAVKPLGIDQQGSPCLRPYFTPKG